MKKSFFVLIAGVFLSVIGVTSTRAAAVTIQDPGNVVGTGTNAWSYLIVEGEDYASELDPADGVGFTRVDNSGAITSFLGNPILGTNTTASKKGALWIQNAAKHGDKVTYQVQFATPGTYYLYMHFTMFESGTGAAHYLNEDSFFVPPDFDKDPQTDWPLMDAGGQNGGYTEGCCDGAGFLSIPEKGGGGVRVNHSAGSVDADGNPLGSDFWEGTFHWNDLLSSQFLNPETQGEPSVRRKYEVTTNQVGKTLTWTISNRESGLAVDLWLFSTNPDLMDQYTQADLDRILLKQAGPLITVQDPGNVVGTGTNAWSYLIVEGEDYASELDPADGVGFTRVDNSGAITNFLGNPILGTNTTASKKGALWIQNAAKHGDKVTYQVQFATPGTYYLYMHFTMFESGTGAAHYLNEDSFFVPPDFDKDPQTDWPLMDAGGQNGGYTEGCCDGAGFLSIPEKGGGGVRVNHSAGSVDADGNPLGSDFWEGTFHWNDLLSSQFLNPETQGEPSVRRKYEVTTNQVGKTLTWTISNRESGLAVDLWLFSTNPDLMDQYTQADLDRILLKQAGPLITVQDPGNVVGTGTNAWSYLIVEGEDYASELDPADGVGFTRVDNSGAITSFLGNPVLGTNTTASKKGALWIQNAAKHGDKVTYQVQFATPGTYYLYMHFTMFESGTGAAHYLNEDSFFVPPDFDKDPQTDWPLMDAGGQNGGYTEGCCDGAGFLSIPEKGGGGVRVNHSAGSVDADGNPLGSDFWEGTFHWNDLLSSQFLNPETQGEPSVRRKYEVTTNQVGKTLTWTISNRESGLAVDLWLFSTNPDLMDRYSQAELDQILLDIGSNPPPVLPKLGINLIGNKAVVSWPSSASDFVLETTSTLSPPNWIPDTSPDVIVVGNEKSVTVDVVNGTKFYRLRKP